MAYTVVDTEFVIIDSAIGPVGLISQTVSGFDIDDFVHTTVLSIAKTLQLQQAALTADPQIAKNRIPVVIGNAVVGGF